MKNSIKTVVVLGYGSQGRAIALNLRDSGYDVIVGLKSRSRSRRLAKSDGFSHIHTIATSVQNTHCVCVALPDHMHGRLFKSDIAPNLAPGSTLVFLHGFSVHFGFVVPPPNCDLLLIAPHAPGVAVREKYLAERDLSAFYAVQQNYSGRAGKTVLELAKALGFEKKRLVKSSFEIEAIGDLFGEQAVLCGGMAELVQSGFELLVAKGLPAENAYLEVAYQLDLIVELMKKHGIEGMYRRISVAARYGSERSGKKIIDRQVKKNMEKVYAEITSGRFAKKLNKLTDKEITALNRRIREQVDPAFEKAARKYAK